jgi:hypothetical protein
MQGAFVIVIVIVMAVSVIGAIAALLLMGGTWKEMGKNSLVMDRDAPRGPAGGAGLAHERDAEIREMLEARNARRLRRGEAPIDVESELARLTAPLVDPELRQEIRDLVIARNNRRIRAGKPALDVDAEIEREIARLSEM